MITNNSITKLIEEFLSETIANPRSRQTYKATLNRFIFFLKKSGRDIENVKRADVVDYKVKLINEGKSALTIDNYLASVRQFFKWMSENGYHSNIAEGIKSPRRSRVFRKKYLTAAQVRKLLDVIPKNSVKGLRDFAIVSLMVRTGMRCIEISRINVEDVLTDDVFCVNIQRKGRVEKEESIGLTDKTIDALNDYLIKRDLNGNPPLFVNHSIKANNQRIKSSHINRIVKGYMESIGLHGKKYSAHSLRHTAACNALLNGASIYDVKAMLGHTSVSTTEIYTDMIDEERRLVNAPGRKLDELY